MVSVDLVRNFWDQHVNNEYYTSADRGSPEYFAQIAAQRYHYHYHLVELFERLSEMNLSEKNLLEIGCGIGIDTIRLASLGFREVVGLDLSATAVDIARTHAKLKNITTVHFETANGEELTLPNNTFDFVYSFGVIHHTPSIETAIAEIHRVLKPGGTAIVMLYHRHSLVNWVHILFRLPFESPRDLKDHCPVVNRYTRQEAKSLFHEFDKVRIRTDYPFTYGMRHLTFFWPTFVKRLIGTAIGWHLMIDAVKRIQSPT
jgi:ubiquinone/menaquinone biosynthesis C-methylase UbiE